MDLTQQTFYEDLKGMSTGNNEDAGKDYLYQNKLIDSKATKAMILGGLERQKIPQTQSEYEDYVTEIRASVTKKYESLIKNAHQYLCYMYLITYNYNKCIEHGKKLIKLGNLATSTTYNVHCYMAEATCMIGQFKDAMTHLDEAENVSDVMHSISNGLESNLAD